MQDWKKSSGANTHKESLATSRRAVQEAAPGREHAELPVVVRPPEVPRQLEDVSQRRLKKNFNDLLHPTHLILS